MEMIRRGKSYFSLPPSTRFEMMNLGGLPGQTVYEYQLRGSQSAEYGFQEYGMPVLATANLAGLDDAAALLGFAGQRVPLVFV